MNREIKFRGIDKKTNEFVYGDLVRMVIGGNIHFYIQPLDSKKIEVHFKTIGQFTVFLDHKRFAIYEGDIISDWVKVDGEDTQSKQQVFWNTQTGSWHLDISYKQDKTQSVDLWLELKDFKYEVTGNIYKM